MKIKTGTTAKTPITGSRRLLRHGTRTAETARSCSSSTSREGLIPGTWSTSNRSASSTSEHLETTRPAPIVPASRPFSTPRLPTSPDPQTRPSNSLEMLLYMCPEPAPSRSASHYAGSDSPSRMYRLQTSALTSSRALSMKSSAGYRVSRQSLIRTLSPHTSNLRPRSALLGRNPSGASRGGPSSTHPRPGGGAQSEPPRRQLFHQLAETIAQPQDVGEAEAEDT